MPSCRYCGALNSNLARFCDNCSQPMREPRIVPSGGPQLLVVSRYELVKFLRGRKLLGILVGTLAVFILVMVITPLAGRKYPATVGDFLSTFTGFTSLLVVLSATFFGADAIVGEFQSRTAYFLFPNPVKRISILFGKLLASSLASVSVVVLYYALISVAGYAIYSSLPNELGLSFLYAIAYTLTILCLSFLVSSIMKGSTGATILVFFLFVMILPLVTSVLSVAQIDPWFVPTFAGGIINYVLTVPYPTSSTLEIGQSGFSSARYVPDINVALVLFTIYALVSVIGTVFFLYRREA